MLSGNIIDDAKNVIEAQNLLQEGDSDNSIQIMNSLGSNGKIEPIDVSNYITKGTTDVGSFFLSFSNDWFKGSGFYTITGKYTNLLPSSTLVGIFINKESLSEKYCFFFLSLYMNGYSIDGDSSLFMSIYDPNVASDFWLYRYITNNEVTGISFDVSFIVVPVKAS